MRSIYQAPDAKHFDILFNNGHTVQHGGSIDDIRIFNSSVYGQRGGSLFSFLGSLIRKSIPFMKNLLLPAAGDMTRGIAHDIANGRGFKESARRHGIDALRNVGRRIVRGGAKKGVRGKKKKGKKGLKKTKRRTKKISAMRVNKCKQMPDDIFSQLH
jgi:hypothetical protein